MSRIIKSDDTFRIEENENYEAGKGNVFLMSKIYSKREFIDVCIGSAEPVVGDVNKWYVIVVKEYDSSTDSDAQVIGYYKTQSEAIEVLWKHRHDAYIGG
jgi:hypothetical protein